jgi:hypothetical protein
MFERSSLGSVRASAEQQKAAHMAVVFAVFLIAVVVAFAHPEGRARRIKQLRAVAIVAVGIGKAVLAAGTEFFELAAARLAQEHRTHAGLDQILAAAGRKRVDPAERNADL